MPSKRPKKTHEDYLKLVCFFCPQKAQRVLNDSQKKFISSEIFEKFKSFEKVLMTGICNTCCRTVNDHIKSFPNKSSRKLPTQNYEKILDELQNLPKLTRSNPTCFCSICKIAKSGCILTQKSPKTIEKKCPKCFAIVKKGKHKNCGRPERVNNLMTELTPKTRMQLCIETIKEQQNAKKSNSPVKASRLSGGPSMPISVGIPSTSSNQR